jgi:hypothetical protein
LIGGTAWAQTIPPLAHHTHTHTHTHPQPPRQVPDGGDTDDAGVDDGDFSDIEKYGIITIGGTDKLGNPVFCFKVRCRVPTHTASLVPNRRSYTPLLHTHALCSVLSMTCHGA